MGRETNSVTELLAGWGNYPRLRGHVVASEDLAGVARAASLCRGLGRSYGDASLPAAEGATVASTLLADRILRFDPASGILRVEAGITLERIKEHFLPRGWFTPVTPGTQYVSIGGMVAADVHGKNHHVAGTFGEHVLAMSVQVADGRTVACSPEQNQDLFFATIGGMGLTGHILEVEFRLERVPSPWILEERKRVRSLEELIECLRAAASAWPFTVAWADLLGRAGTAGRGILMTGRWASAEEAPARAPKWMKRRQIPFDFPNWLLSPLAVRTFNRLILAKELLAPRRHVIHPETFFYPLDKVGNWNRCYGKRGFTQYQCVLPYDDRCKLHREFLTLLRRLGAQCYLCVVKDCGVEGHGLISFPKPGISFALDFPNCREKTREWVDGLNEFVLAHGGRIYLAKDAYTRREHFAGMEPRLAAWQRVRAKWDPARKFQSALSRRVLEECAP